MFTIVRSLIFCVCLTPLTQLASAQEAASSIATQSVVHFTFEEESGSAKDRATTGQHPDEGKLVNDPARVRSPFWNQTGKKAVLLDATKQQCLEIPSSPDVSAPQGITVSMFGVNLTEPTDSTFHGLFAKRGTTDGKLNANYGINFQMQSDNFQVYIHDGTDYRVASYAAKDAVPFRKLTHIAVTYTVGDAPDQDADADFDDVRMQYFINGEPLTPKAVTRGFVNGNEAWTLDVNLAGLVNALPLSVGRSEPTIEYTNCVIGDFRLFSRALSADEVKKLFHEVAGANVHELIAADKPAPLVAPVISSLSQSGLQAGQTTELIVNGNELSPNSVAVFPLPDVQFAVADGSTASRLVLKVTVPSDTVPGIYPLWIKSAFGISKSTVIAIDRLPLQAIGSSADKPATLPVAFYGTLSGGQQHVVYIDAKKGQRLVADVELKRLGGSSNPVIEIKSPSGSPLVIGWGQNSLRGDARAEVVFPADGLYTVELHDLTFNAPGTNAFRLKLGDLKLIDGMIPAAMLPGEVALEPIGTGFSLGTKFIGRLSVPEEGSSGSLALAADTGVSGGLPSIPLSRGKEYTEISGLPEGAYLTIDATFSQPNSRLIGISGRISKKGERDVFLLNVAPGQKLKFTLQTDSIGSPLAGELQILDRPNGTAYTIVGDEPIASDPTIVFSTSENTKQLAVQVQDVFGRGDSRSFYRLVIEPPGQPQFSIRLTAPNVNLPEDGSTTIETQVTRTDYSGPIRLRLIGDPAVSITPNVIPPNVQGKLLFRLARRGTGSSANPSILRLVAESVGIEPVFHRTARLQSSVVASAFTDAIGLGTTASEGLSIESQPLPTVLFRGVSVSLDVVVTRQPGQPSASLPVKLGLDSTEPVRRRDPNNPAAGTFPVVTIEQRILFPEEPAQANVKLLIPLEVAEPAIDFVVRADALPHAYSERVLARAFAEPFHAEIKNAVSPKADEASLAFVGDTDHKLTGQVQRTAGFNGVVELAVVGLPAGYTVQTSTVAADQDKFEIAIRGPKVEGDPQAVNVKLRVTSAGSLLVAEIPIVLKVMSGK